MNLFNFSVFSFFASTPAPPKRAPLHLPDADHAPYKKRQVSFTSAAPISPPASPSAHHPSYLAEHFTTVRKLGSGCFGDVRAVRSKSTNEEFALKEAKVDKLKNNSGYNFTKAQLMEVRMHKSLGFHPNIVTFLQAWREERSLYLLMELCAISLEGHWIRKETLAADEIFVALTHLGASNIGHFDIKPANVLRTTEENYKLADFTVASRLDQIERDCEFGDSKYAAPELLNDQFTLKADVYSLGLTLAEVSVPSSAPLTSTEWDILKQKGELPERVAHALSSSFELSNKVLRMIERDHHRRASVDDLLERKAIDPIEAELARHRMEANRQRLAASMSAGVDRKVHESEHLTRVKAGPLFDNDVGFFTMPQPIRNPRSTGRLITQGTRASLREIARKLDFDD